MTTFFLFTALYYFPSGAEQFLTFADAIVRGKALDSAIAQRDIGYPLLLIIGGWTVWRSFIGITVVQAAFAVLMPMLVYWSLVRVSPTVAFYAGVLSALSLAPILFMKWIHHDQAYIFFMLLVIALLASYLQSRGALFLYLFTAAAVAASFTRPAGNLLFPILLLVAYLTARGKLRNYLVCAAIVVVAAGVYRLYRYEIFDMAHQANTPSYTGEQVFYNLYINSADFGIQLSPDLGPATKQITEDLRQKIGPDFQRSAYMQAFLAQERPAFAEQALLPYGPDQLIDRIYQAPNWEYYLLLASVDSDQLYLQSSIEIARAHPWYVVQYVVRNTRSMLFDPGYAHTRYNTNGSFQKIGLDFLPAGGLIFDPSVLGPRGNRELSYGALQASPLRIQLAFDNARRFWQRSFGAFLTWTSRLMIVAWLVVVVRLAALLRPKSSFSAYFSTAAINATVASTIAASTFLLYNDIVTAAFAEPDYRYFLFTELLRILVAGCGAALVIELISSAFNQFGWLRRHREVVHAIAGGILRIQNADVLARAFGPRERLMTLITASLAMTISGVWAGFMIAHTW